MKTQGIMCLSQYLETIEKLQSHYPAGITNNPTSTTFLYRGMPDVKYSLMPSVFRKQYDDIDGQVIDNDTYLAWSKEKDLLFSFIHEACSYISISPENLGQWAEYAQHYGVPTRFLDWSSNPLAALYFACRDKATCDGAVWVLHRNNYNRFLRRNINMPDAKEVRRIISDLLDGKSNVEFPILYAPYYVDFRMSAQGSFFMVWGTKVVPLEELLKNDQFYMKYSRNDDGIRSYGAEQENAILFKSQIYANRKLSLLRELDAVGVNEKTLFPGLDGIGRYVERKYHFDYHEAVENF